MERKFNAKTLIEAVKSRPILFNKTDPGYSSTCDARHNKLGEWKAVCREIYSDYDAVDSQKKSERLFEVRRRWKNIRTCFTRDLAQQRQADLLGKPRKRYEYFDDLTFLLDQYESQAYGDVSILSNNNSDEASSDTAMDDSNFKTEKLEYINLQADPVKSLSIDEQNEFLPRTTEEQLIEIIKEMKRGEHDDDKQFIMSLLPSFKRLDDEKKLEAKIEILKVLQKLTYN